MSAGAIQLYAPATRSHRETDRREAWQDDALCANTDPEAFHPEKGGSTKSAKSVCASCDVVSQCLAYAIKHGIREGIWGGLSVQERRDLERVPA